MANTNHNRLSRKTTATDSLVCDWNAASTGEEDICSRSDHAELNDTSEASSEVALLCANIQADIGHAAPFGDLAGLLQTLYALTTAVANADKKRNQDTYVSGAVAGAK